MSELERLKSALNEAPPEQFAAPDLTRIMADGTRIRRRRRLLTGAGAAAAVVAVVAVVFGAVQLRPQPQPQQQPVAAAPSTVGPASTVPSTSAAERQQATPLGDVVSLGIKNATGELVLYAFKIDEPQTMPGVGFGLMLAVRDAGGLHPVYAANEVNGADRSFGFHATSGGLIAGTDAKQVQVPVLGYFAGPAARITSSVHGKPVNAHLARWSEDPGVVFFWFDPVQVPSAAALTPLAAYNAGGTRLTK
ncbi:hypothetical protein [Amycolatopsis saalfeldensis]|uniref:Uncharacterized protein n=1 Tax=Amycolatopsis saalfeldensis TaxID=394193 RepID=A0A1H8YBX9_9PSEU|nr:hypothetical protein [Amycolatopsis saalfeldensis]SEP49521.1 hypothetical protein SAMN04489732_11393 [Amycolatopsis saalfeldensis]